MKLFELEQRLARPIVEGGNAIKSSSRINQENVAATLADIEKRLLPLLNVSVSGTANLGSTGKKAPGDSSGDIDLGISVQELTVNNGLKTPQELYDFVYTVANKMSDEVKDMRSIGLISLAWPIANVDSKQEGEFVQLDLMIVDSIDWAKWAYYAPAYNESPYKGLYRNELLYAVARFMDYTVIHRAMDDSGQEVDAEWKRNFFDLGKGILTGTQTRMGKKGIVKAVKTLNKEIVSADPREAVKMLFGPHATPNDVLTWEDTFRAVMSNDFPYKNNRPEILQMTKQGILNKGYPIPPELEKVVG